MTAPTQRKIFDRAPGSWRSLQSCVAQVFDECGCEASCGVTVKLPRGQVELDVFVRDRSTAPHSNYICECKYWTRPVSQSAVHSFRTVVAELGANRGLLISRNGFQAGAREAAKFTNIDLLTWSEFEDLMFDRWVAGITRRLDPLFVSAYALMADGEDLWKLRECTEDAWNERERICHRHQLVIIWALFFWHSGAGFLPMPSLRVRDNSTGRRPRILNSYRKIVDAAPRICLHARRELEAFWRVDTGDDSPRSRKASGV